MAFKIDLTGPLGTTHGHRKSRNGKSSTYYSWQTMKDRCSNPNATGWPLYGGRGVTVCERWASFEAFLEDMGERPNGLTLDRINPEGNYEPENCRWATPLEQTLNRRKTATKNF